DVKEERLQIVNAELESPDVWNDPKHAQDLGRGKKALETIVLTINEISAGVQDSLDLFAMAAEENDDDTLNAIADDVQRLEDKVAGLEFRRMFSNPADPLNCFVDIQAGA